MYVGIIDFELIVHYVEGYLHCLYILHEDVFSLIKFRELHKSEININLSEYFKIKYPEYDDMQLIKLFVDMYITFITNNYEEINK